MVVVKFPWKRFWIGLVAIIVFGAVLLRAAEASNPGFSMLMVYLGSGIIGSAMHHVFISKRAVDWQTFPRFIIRAFFGYLAYLSFFMLELETFDRETAVPS